MMLALGDRWVLDGQLAAVLTYTRPAPASGSQECWADGARSSRGRTGLTMMRSGPDTMEPFIKVPKVLGEGEGA